MEKFVVNAGIWITAVVAIAATAGFFVAIWLFFSDRSVNSSIEDIEAAIIMSFAAAAANTLLRWWRRGLS